MQNFLGYIMSVWCLYKMIISCINIVFKRVGKIDSVSRGIEITLKYVFFLPPDAIDVPFWSQVVSFCLVSIVGFTSFRGFLIQITKTFQALSSSLSSGLVILLLAEVMGMYFLSTVVMMRMSIPPQYRQIITQVFGDIEFHFYHSWSDVIFFVSSMVTLVLLIATRDQRPPADKLKY
jgi:hypothetical protein